MRTLFFFMLGILSGAFSLSAQQAAPVRKVWDENFGGTSDDFLHTMLPTPDGGYLLGGWSKSDKGWDKSENSRGDYDYWIVKTDAQGKKLWDKTFGGASSDYELRVMLSTADGGYLLSGWSQSNGGRDKTEDPRGYYDYWVIKIDANGNKLWDKIFGGSYPDLASAMLPTADGGYLLGGYSSSNKGWDKSEVSRGDYDYWIIKIDAQGKKLWDKTIGGTARDILITMLPTADGGYLLGGMSNSNKGADKSEDCKGDDDYWIIKIDADGNKLWDKIFGGSSNDRLYTMLPTADGGYLLGGSSDSNKSGDKSEDSRGDIDYWIIKIDARGNKLWDKIFGGSSSDWLSTMLPTADGGYLLGGWGYSNIGGDKSEDSRGDSDYWIIKIDAEGNKLWDKTFGGNSRDGLNAMLPTTDGGYLLGGWSGSDKEEDKSGYSRGGADYWIIKIAIDPTGIAETPPTDKALSVYPNPAKEYLNVHLGGVTAGNYQLTLTDMTGKKVLTTEPYFDGVQDCFTWMLPTLPSGNYVLSIRQGAQTLSTQKIMIP